MSKYVIYDDDGSRIKTYDKSERAYFDALSWNITRDGRYEVREEEDPSALFQEGNEENSDETNSDNDTSTMSNYDFISTNDDEESDNYSDQFNTVGSMWNLGDHSTASSDERSALSEAVEDTMSQLDDDIDGDMMAVLEDASDMVRDTRVNTFECPHENCGLGHSHADHKHDIRGGFDVLDSFAEQMEFTPYCHCGVNELSMLMDFFPYISEPVFADQEWFEGVLEVEPKVLNMMYRRYNQDGASISKAAAVTASELMLNETEAIPLGVREDLEMFFERRQQIQNAADAAPIPGETRNVIDQSRDELEAITSE